MERSRILSAIRRELWAIRPEVLAGWAEVSARPTKLPAVKGNVAIIPIHGAISHRPSIWQEVFGGSSTMMIQAGYARAVNDERIGAIVFDVDSPGGTVAGIREAAAIIREGSAIKETFAVANSDCCSAAYWLASQVGPGHMIAAPGADVGSIGVFTVHEDVSEMLEDAGVKVSVIAVPEHKAEFSPYAPLTDEAMAHMMQQITDTYESFVADVAHGRGVSAAKVKADFGKGRVFHASTAKDLGMVDRVATLAEVVGELTRKSNSSPVNATTEVEESIQAAFANCEPEQLRRPERIANRRRRMWLKSI